jgi:hypothetical protein
VSTSEVQREEIVNTALACGFTQEQVNMAFETLAKPNEELKLDDVLSWLQNYYPIQ